MCIFNRLISKYNRLIVCWISEKKISGEKFFEQNSFFKGVFRRLFNQRFSPQALRQTEKFEKCLISGAVKIRGSGLGLG